MQSNLKTSLKLPVDPVNSKIYDLYQRYLSSRLDTPVYKPVNENELAINLQNMIARYPKGSDFLYEILENILIEHSMNLQNPMYMGHQVPPTLPLAVMLDMLVGGLNQSLAVNKMSPVLSEIERQLIKFLALQIGYSQGANGTITSGGSISNLLGLLGARKKYFPEALDPRATIITGNQSHYSVNKAATIMGLNKKNVLAVETDKEFRIRPEKVVEMIEKARVEGKIPFVIAANAGSTSTGSFDDINVLADIAEAHNLWLHIDGAHGASVTFSEELQYLIQGIEKADSISWDGHKMLYMPSSIGIALFKNGQDLQNIFKEDQAPYLYNCPKTALDLSKMSLQCTRRGDALKLWGCLVAYGTDFFSARIEHVKEITDYFYTRLLAHPNLKPMHRPMFNIICFRYIPENESLTEQEINDINSNIRDTANATGELMMTLTSLRGTVALRTTIINPATQKEHIDRLIDIIEENAPV
jgi:L-2,4-diaminobutyrate decarboxylase